MGGSQVWVIDWLVNNIVATLNFLTITIPIGAAVMVGQNGKIPRYLRIPAALLTAAAAIVVFYVIYPFLGFPLWVGWLHAR